MASREVTVKAGLLAKWGRGSGPKDWRGPNFNDPATGEVQGQAGSSNSFSRQAFFAHEAARVVRMPLLVSQTLPWQKLQLYSTEKVPDWGQSVSVSAAYPGWADSSSAPCPLWGALHLKETVCSHDFLSPGFLYSLFLDLISISLLQTKTIHWQVGKTLITALGAF